MPLKSVFLSVSLPAIDMNHRLVNLKKLIDPWSVPHFLFGAVTALGAIVFDLPIPASFAATFVLAVLWEQLEKYFRLSEAPGNAWMDVLLPLIAFTMTFSLVSGSDIGEEQARAFFAVSLLLYIFVNFFAWRARIERDREFQG